MISISSNLPIKISNAAEWKIDVVLSLSILANYSLGEGQLDSEAMSAKLSYESSSAYL
jgi:hypothetical protein